MTPDAVRADRNHAVRTAAREWAGIDAVTLSRIDALYPDDRSRVGPVFRVLLFAFALLAGAAATGLAYLVVPSTWVAVLMGVVLLAATEVQAVALRRVDGGAEAATAFLGTLLLVVGTALVLAESLHPGEVVLTRVALSLAAAVCWLGAGRWGMPFLAVLGGIACAGLLATLPGGRVLWLAVALAAVVPLLRASTARRFPPAQRTAFAGSLVVTLGAGYLAVNLWSLDSGWIERFGEHALVGSPWVRGLAVVATAVAPLLTLRLGVARRRRLLLWAGAAMAAASVVTLRHYFPLGPLWLWLTAWGVLCVTLALAVRRALAAAAGGERSRFTIEAATGARRLEAAATTAASVATLTPETRPAEPEAAFRPGGGGFGGGGATDSF